MVAKQQGGFTLVELIIVLAISALILAGVLIAATGAQSARRDKERKDIALQLWAKAYEYGEKTKYNYSGFSCAGCSLVDPDTGAAPDVVGSGNIHATKTSGVQFRNGKGCVTGGADTNTLGPGNYAITFWSEGENIGKCIDSRDLDKVY